MAVATARALVGQILHRPLAELDELATSGIAELTNVIASRACVLLDVGGYPCTATPAALIAGAGVRIPRLAVQRLVVPLHLSLGTVELQVALKEHGSGVVAQS